MIWVGELCHALVLQSKSADILSFPVSTASFCSDKWNIVIRQPSEQKRKRQHSEDNQSKMFSVHYNVTLNLPQESSQSPTALSSFLLYTSDIVRYNVANVITHISLWLAVRDRTTPTSALSLNRWHVNQPRSLKQLVVGGRGKPFTVRKTSHQNTGHLP